MAQSTPQSHSSAKTKSTAHTSAPAKSKSAPDAASAFVHGAFCWNELMTHDLAKAKAFYAATLGWQYEAMPMPEGGTYWIIKKPGHPVGLGGLLEMKGTHFEGMPERWVPYISVEDVDTVVKAAVKAGAHVLKEPFDIADVGRIAGLREPGGAMVCLMTPLPKG